MDIYPKKMGIYCLTNKINQKSYIGKTVNFRKRFSYYRSGIKLASRTSPIELAIKKYGWENFQISLIEIFDNIDNLILLNKESLWIQKLNTLCPTGYNIVPFHMDNTGVPCSPVTKLKLSIANKGKQAKENNPFFGKTHSTQSKNQMSEAHVGRDYHYIKRRPVQQLDIHNALIKIWPSVTEASLFISGVVKNNIPRAIKKDTICLGFRWRYV